MERPGTTAEEVPLRVLDLRGTAPVPPLSWQCPAGHRVVVSGLPGSGKSTLMRRTTVADGAVLRIDSHDTRELWERHLPTWLPYPLYRPAVRVAHYARLWQALRSGKSVIVHDCGRSSWVRSWLAWDARRRGCGLHLLLLDVPSDMALAGQVARGRAVSMPSFSRHQRGVVRLIADVEAGRLPQGFVSAALLDATAARALTAIVFADSTKAAPLLRT